MALNFEISAGTGTPIYLQIEAQIRRAVAAGHLKEGQQLPSVRALAEQLTVNPNTIARAYSDLIAEGLLESQPGRGFFIGPYRQMLSLEERRRRLQDALETFVDEVAFLDLSSAEILKAMESRLSFYTRTRKSNPPKP